MLRYFVGVKLIFFVVKMKIFGVGLFVWMFVGLVMVLKRGVNCIFFKRKGLFLFVEVKVILILVLCNFVNKERIFG